MCDLRQLSNCVSSTWGLSPGAKDEFWGQLALEGKWLGLVADLAALAQTVGTEVGALPAR